MNGIIGRCLRDSVRSNFLCRPLSSHGGQNYTFLSKYFCLLNLIQIVTSDSKKTVTIHSSDIVLYCRLSQLNQTLLAALNLKC